ncbi:MAG TPA: MoaD/ThiS family protein [Steroidobacteraceae bacterium]|jgi:molybdopterin converting factor small subunit|nr:MoaD/ThiS family protein [Steroidobacteraceae bacterium]
MSCTVRIPSPLRSYTSGAATVPAGGGTIGEVLGSLEQRFAGIRFRMVDEQDRIRRHIRLYVNTAEVTALSQAVRSGDVVHVICALSGG